MTNTPAEEVDNDANVVYRSATVGVDNLTIADIEQAAESVGAPADARIATNVGPTSHYPYNVNVNHPFNVTFSWTEEL